MGFAPQESFTLDEVERKAAAPQVKFWSLAQAQLPGLSRPGAIAPPQLPRRGLSGATCGTRCMGGAISDLGAR